MAVSAAQIERVRSLSDASASDFSDATITVAIQAYPLHDSVGRYPDNVDWEPTYCLYNAAADILDQRAVKESLKFDTTADGATLSRSQVSKQLSELARRLRLRGAVKIKRALTQRAVDDYIINLPEEDDET